VRGDRILPFGARTAERERVLEVVDLLAAAGDDAVVPLSAGDRVRVPHRRGAAQSGHAGRVWGVAYGVAGTIPYLAEAEAGARLIGQDVGTELARMARVKESSRGYHMEITVKVPERYLAVVDASELASRVALYAALLMFRAGELSAGAATEFAGVDRFTFTAECRKHGIPLIDYSPEELQPEVDSFLLS